jgi:hypothetical protein
MKTNENASTLSCWRRFIRWIQELFQHDVIDFPVKPLEVLEVQMTNSNGTKFIVSTFPDTGCNVSCISMTILKKMGYSKSDIRRLRVPAVLV